MPDALRVHADDRAAWRAWLTEHADASTGIWLVYDKGPGRRLSYDDIVEEALCFGWIDSRPRSLDGIPRDGLRCAPEAAQQLVAGQQEARGTADRRWVHDCDRGGG